MPRYGYVITPVGKLSKTLKCGICRLDILPTQHATRIKRLPLNFSQYKGTAVTYTHTKCCNASYSKLFRKRRRKKKSDTNLNLFKDI